MEFLSNSEMNVILVSKKNMQISQKYIQSNLYIKGTQENLKMLPFIYRLKLYGSAYNFNLYIKGNCS
jgi:hypothetical protein